MRRKKNKFSEILLIGLLALVALTWLLTLSPFKVFSGVTNAISQTDFANEANQQIITQNPNKMAPLILQTDEQWAQHDYGISSDGSSETTMARNGCAIASLSMVLSYWRDTPIAPNEILNWAQNNYYVEGQGTAWSIFPDFAGQYQLNYHDLGDDVYAAQSFLEQGIPVVASVVAGDFTDGGHILVLRDWTAEGISVNDPNDDPQKNHFTQRYSPEQIASQTIHYWAFTG